MLTTMKAGSNPVRPTHPWPFRAAPHIVSDHGVGVPARQNVILKDGNGIWLLHVIDNGTANLYLRDLGEPLEGVRIDLRKLLADVEKELPTTNTRDVAGWVAISLRLKYPTLDEFLEAVGRGARA